MKLVFDLESLRIALGHLAASLAGTATLISQPHLAVLVMLGVGSIMVANLGSSLALTYLHVTKQREALPKNYLGLIGTYLGGALVYSVILRQAAKFLLS